MNTYYRGYVISYWAKPIPDRSHDWEGVHEDYDGADDSGDVRAGTAGSIEECKAAIDELEDGQ